MLLKIHSFCNISLNLCEIHLKKFWLQNIKHFKSYGTLNFDLSFLCTKVSFSKPKRVATFLLVKIMQQKNFQKLYAY